VTKGTQDIWFGILLIDLFFLSHPFRFRDVFGDMVWSVGNDGSPVFETRRSLLQRGKRIIFENQKEIWLDLEDGVVPVVQAPVMWSAHQFDDGDLQEYPNCTSKSH
jgi:hypothetical protein